MRWLRLAAWLVVIGLAGVLAVRFAGDRPVEVREPLPVLTMAELENRDRFDPDSIEGPWLLNVWGSWCAPCHAEHSTLMALRSEGIAIYGLNWRDRPEDAEQFLDELGDPFVAVMQDVDNQSVMALGISGAPETLVVSDGQILARWPGPLTVDVLRQTIYPALERADRR